MRRSALASSHSIASVRLSSASMARGSGWRPNQYDSPTNRAVAPLAQLMVMGNWLDRYGESIYGTRKGPVRPAHWGATTKKGNTVYIHILDLKEESLLIPEFKEKIKKAIFFDDKSKVKFKTTEFGTIFSVPDSKKNKIDTILIVEI